MEFEKQFDEKFDCDLSQDGVAKWTINEKLLDGQIMRYRAVKEDIKRFIDKAISQSIEEERNRIAEKLEALSSGGCCDSEKLPNNRKVILKSGLDDILAEIKKEGNE